MKNILETKKGDISLIIVILISGIMLTLLLPLSQKITVESNISKENLMSQQSVQAARTGLDEWKFNLVEGNIDVSPGSTTTNWPNINTPSNVQRDGDWIILSSNGNQQIQYQIVFTDTPIPSITAKGRVKNNNFTIERTLTESFNPSQSNPSNNFVNDVYRENVSLLLNMNGNNDSTTFIDSSIYNWPVSIFSGTPKISTAQSKFGGASGFFLSNSRVTVNDAPELEMTGDFTIETWVYPLSNGGLQVAGHTQQNVQLFRLNYGGVGSLGFYLNGTFVFVDTPANIQPNQWTHLAISRQNGITRMFVNGQQVGNSISNWTGSFKINMVGGSQFGGFNGYIDDFRVTKGVARYKCEKYNNFYSSKFTIPGDPVQVINEPYIPVPSPFLPASQDPNYNDVTLLLNMEGCEGDDKLIDSSKYSRQTIFNPNYNPAKINSAQKKFGFSSILSVGFNGRTVYADAPELEMTGDFTIETWVYPLNSSDMFVAGHTQQNVQLFRLNEGGQQGRITFWMDNRYVFVATPANIQPNRWTHLAISRQNGITRMFVDGQQVGGNNITWTGSFKINIVGGSQFGGFNGYIDDFRVTKGVARYINNFTLPGN